MESKITNIFKFYSKLFIKLSQLNVSSFLWLIKTKTVITKVCGGQTECHLMNVEPVKSVIEPGDLSSHGDTAGAGLLEVDGAGHLGGALQHADCLDHRDKLGFCLEMWD